MPPLTSQILSKASRTGIRRTSGLIRTGCGRLTLRLKKKCSWMKDKKCTWIKLGRSLGCLLIFTLIEVNSGRFFKLDFKKMGWVIIFLYGIDQLLRNSIQKMKTALIRSQERSNSMTWDAGPSTKAHKKATSTCLSWAKLSSQPPSKLMQRPSHSLPWLLKTKLKFSSWF